jgi:RNAse (barnase) inhibitor barstar
MEREYVIDGMRTNSLEAFYDEFSRVALDAPWGRNLDAFNDVLRGGFGTPNEGFTLRWSNSAAARALLDYPETIRQLQLRLERCHPANRERVQRELSDAERGLGPTVFDWLVEIISDHGPGGGQAKSNVRLILD